jgi:hypothetical protein
VKSQEGIRKENMEKEKAMSWEAIERGFCE